MRRLKINVVVRVNLIEKVTLRKDLRKLKDGALWTLAVRVIQAERMASGRALRQEPVCYGNSQDGSVVRGLWGRETGLEIKGWWVADTFGSVGHRREVGFYSE